MIDIHAPLSEASSVAVRSLIAYTTDGLDAVVIKHNPSVIYSGWLCMTVAGNDRDIATAVERAAKVGGKVD